METLKPGETQKMYYVTFTETGLVKRCNHALEKKRYLLQPKHLNNVLFNCG